MPSGETPTFYERSVDLPSELLSSQHYAIRVTALNATKNYFGLSYDETFFYIRISNPTHETPEIFIEYPTDQARERMNQPLTTTLRTRHKPDSMLLRFGPGDGTAEAPSS